MIFPMFVSENKIEINKIFFKGEFISGYVVGMYSSLFFFVVLRGLGLLLRSISIRKTI